MGIHSFMNNGQHIVVVSVEKNFGIQIKIL